MHYLFFSYMCCMVIKHVLFVLFFLYVLLCHKMCIICSSKALQCHETCALTKAAHGIMVLIASAKSEGSGAPVHPCRLNSIELDVGLDQESDICPTRWLSMCIRRMTLRRTTSTIISCHISFVFFLACAALLE